MKPAEFEFTSPTIGAGENRWIVLQQDEGKLRIKGAKQRATSSGYIDPVSDLSKPGYIDPTTDI